MLQRLLTHVVNIIMPESQCGFRRNRSTIDMVFVARLLQEKCCEQHSSLYPAFIDLTKAFDTVNRTLLWGILSKFGCTPQFLAVLRKFHDGMPARVVLGGLESDPFMVNVGVKQGCVLAPVIFNLFLVAITLLFRNRVLPADSVGIIIALMAAYLTFADCRQRPKLKAHMCLNFSTQMALPSQVTQLLGCNRT